MKKALIFLSFFLIIVISCKDNDCVITDPVCEEVAPTNEVCQAFFERWFFDSSSSTCEKIGYSGCEQYGFATQEECLSCKCID